ncbi:MAG TPA: hypothetical protein DCW71_08075 [Alistipes sp.]|nr:hypothetical protein [Alistipes sp.]
MPFKGRKKNAYSQIFFGTGFLPSLVFSGRRVVPSRCERSFRRPPVDRTEAFRPVPVRFDRASPFGPPQVHPVPVSGRLSSLLVRFGIRWLPSSGAWLPCVPGSVRVRSPRASNFVSGGRAGAGYDRMNGRFFPAERGFAIYFRAAATSP